MKPDYNRELFSGFISKAMELGLIPRIKTLLTIGERAPDFKIIEASRLGMKITVLEPFKDNFQAIIDNPYINQQNITDSWKFVCADIAQILEPEVLKKAKLDQYGIVWWFHGIEHLDKEVGKKVLDVLVKNCKIIIMSMPNGLFPQTPEDVGGTNGLNPYELHKSAWYEEDFKDYNATVFAVGERDDKTSLDVFIKGDRY